MVELPEHPQQLEAAEHLVEEVRQRLLEGESTANTIRGALHCKAPTELLDSWVDHVNVGDEEGAHPQHVHSVVVRAEVFTQGHQEFAHLHDTNKQLRFSAGTQVVPRDGRRSHDAPPARLSC